MGDVARDTETKMEHVDSKNTRVVLPQPPRFHPKGTEFEVKNELCQNSSLIDHITRATYK
ncbi:hypothetical protein Hanom_Chr04g00301891 [Helianthus anomalus]